MTEGILSTTMPTAPTGSGWALMMGMETGFQMIPRYDSCTMDRQEWRLTETACITCVRGIIIQISSAS